jgi:hypothetical protein
MHKCKQRETLGVGVGRDGGSRLIFHRTLSSHISLVRFKSDHSFVLLFYQALISRPRSRRIFKLMSTSGAFDKPLLAGSPRQPVPLNQEPPNADLLLVL